MSLITEAVIVFYDTRGLGERLTAPLPFDSRGQAFALVDTAAAGGFKVFCDSIAVAAFNYVSPYELIDWFYDVAGDHASATMTLDQEGTRYVAVAGWDEADGCQIVTGRQSPRVVAGELAQAEIAP